jgi:hypothetical protein
MLQKKLGAGEPPACAVLKLPFKSQLFSGKLNFQRNAEPCLESLPGGQEFTLGDGRLLSQARTWGAFR